MSSESFPSSDLRRSATESKRVHDQKAKWAYGTRGSEPFMHDLNADSTGRVSTHNRPVNPSSGFKG